MNLIDNFVMVAEFDEYKCSLINLCFFLYN
jgi:hypothetical protein